MIEALEKWHEFYLLVGTAGATLLALLFVAVSLGVGYLGDRDQRATRIFMSPVAIHFSAVFFISAICLVPSHSTTFFAAIIGMTAAIGAAVSAVITVGIMRSKLTQYVPDHFAYGLVPVFGYLAMVAAAAMIYGEQLLGLDVLAGALLLLALVNIRNAWDLTLTMVRRHAGERK
jgi:MFS family permease